MMMTSRTLDLQMISQLLSRRGVHESDQNDGEVQCVQDKINICTHDLSSVEVIFADNEGFILCRHCLLEGQRCLKLS